MLSVNTKIIAGLTDRLPKTTLTQFYTMISKEDYYRLGRERGYDFASHLIAVIDYSDVINEDNWEEAVRDTAYDNEAEDRQFSPFEFLAREINSLPYSGEGLEDGMHSPPDMLCSEDAWLALDRGISKGINIALYLHQRKNR